MRKYTQNTENLQKSPENQTEPKLNPEEYDKTPRVMYKLVQGTRMGVKEILEKTQ